MSDNIPLELQVEIIKRVSVKSLLQFRSVSKEWKSVIDSPDFADDDTLHQHQIPTTTLPISVNNLIGLEIVGCSHGLVCFYGSDHRDRSPMVVLWNPWIRKSVDVPIPNVLFDRYETILGFGVSPQTKDPKIVKINSIRSPHIEISVPIPCRNSIRFRWNQVALDGVIYWLAFEWITVDDSFRRHNLIMSFDLSSEVFEEVHLPDNLACRNIYDLSIFKRMESIVVLEKTETFYGVWMMGQGVTKSFAKLFNVSTRGSSFCIVSEFMKNGEPIVDHRSDALFAYDPYSERIKDLGIAGQSLRFSVNSYIETLLLIHQ